MLSIFVSTCCLMWVAGPDQSASKADLSAYDAAKAKVGHDADAQVKLALWCETHGLSAERIKHLMLATLINPGNPTARGLLGLVANGAKWQKPEEVTFQLDIDPQARETRQEYVQRRAATPDKAEAQWKLAQWCEQAGLPEQAVAHYHAVIRLDPRREAAWKKLGYKKSGEQWVKPDQLAAEKTVAEHQKLANKHWKPILERYRDGLNSKNTTRRTQAETAVAGITDPWAVPAVWGALVKGDEHAQFVAVQVLGQIDAPTASRALAALAVFASSPSVRGRAIDTAVRRDPRDFLTSTLGLIRRPFKYQVRPTSGPGSEGVLFVEGEKYNIQRLYRVGPFDPSTLPPRIFSPDVPFDPFSVPNLMLASGWAGAMPASIRATAQDLGLSIAASPAQMATLIRQHSAALKGAASQTIPNLALATQMAAVQRDQQIAIRVLEQAQYDQAARQTLQQDIQSIEVMNAGIRDLNDRALPLAKAATGQDFGSDSDSWMKWWTNELGYAYQSPEPATKPTYTDVINFQYQPPPHGACFSAGTLVRTIGGSQAIETLQVGDRVLSQNTSTGALSFQPVVAIHHNQPSTTMRLLLGGETIIATGIHRFWKAGTGWTMARDLKPGDTLRTLGGITKVESVEPDKVQLVYNLDVAEHRDFFVGNVRCLVYDFSIVQPVLLPFDQTPELAAIESKAR
jgi:hypothetical protein